MNQYTAEELREAKRSIASTLSKCETEPVEIWEVILQLTGSDAKAAYALAEHIADESRGST